MRRNALRLSRPTALNSSAAIRATERRCRKKLRQYCSCHLHRAISFYRDGAGENTTLPRYNPIDTGMKFLPVDLSIQLLPGTFEHALSHLIDHELDLRVLDERL